MNRGHIVLGLVLALVLGAVCTYGQQPAPLKTSLKVGDLAPDFTLKDQDRKDVKLSDFRGKQSVVLAFYPAAFTGG